MSSIFPPPYVGGAERSLELLVAELKEEGFLVTVLALHPEWKSRVDRVDGVEVVRMRIPNLYWRWARVKRRPRVAEIAWNAIDMAPSPATFFLRRRIRALSPDVVLTSNVLGWAYAPWRAAKRLRIPLVHVVRDYSMICVRSNLIRNGVECATTCAKCLPRVRATLRAWPDGHVVGISQEVVRQHVDRGVFAGSVVSISHPLTGSATGAQRVSLGPLDSLRIGYLGRLSPEKGLEVLLDAAAQLGVVVRVAGDGASDYVEELKRRYPRAEFLGHVGAAAFLSSVDLLVVPSRWAEPFGRVVADAAVAGVPCIVSERGGLVEAAGVSGATFMSFDPSDADELASLIRQAADNSADWATGDPTAWPAQSVPDIIRAVVASDTGYRS